MTCSGNHYLLSKSTAAFLDERSGSVSGFNRIHSISNPNFAVKTRFPKIRAVVSDQISSFNNDLAVSNRIVTDDNEFYDQTIEKWMEGSVTEIVRNITQAPLLLQIYANGEVKTEKAVKTKIWPNVITEKSSLPDGIILVEELKDETVHEEEFRCLYNEEGGTKAFGVLIQVKLMEEMNVNPRVIC